MTDAERLLWSRLRGKQLKDTQVYRQRIIGNYIVDFYCPRSGLVIEVDGGQHYSEEAVKEDQSRDQYMRDQGMKILRFSDLEIFENLNGVVEKIYETL